MNNILSQTKLSLVSSYHSIGHIWSLRQIDNSCIDVNAMVEISIICSRRFGLVIQFRIVKHDDFFDKHCSLNLLRGSAFFTRWDPVHRSHACKSDIRSAKSL